MSPRKARALSFTEPFTIDQLVEAGFSMATLRAWRERGAVTELTAGVYAPIASDKMDVWRSIFTSKRVANGEAPVSAIGAARLHGMWLPPETHAALAHEPIDHEVPERFIVQCGRLLVPSRTWTALQIARYQRLPGALIPLDWALNAGSTRAQLHSVASCLLNWPGAARLVRAIECADGNSGSALESWSRGLMIECDVPLPALQRRFQVDGFVYYADFAWESAHLIGEADGGDKYRQEAEIFKEKRRQARLQSAGYTVYRWGWPEVRRNADAWVRGLQRALARAA